MHDTAQISSRELKVGLTVISMLVIALGGVVAKRFLLVAESQARNREDASGSTPLLASPPPPDDRSPTPLESGTRALRPRILPAQSGTGDTLSQVSTPTVSGYRPATDGLGGQPTLLRPEELEVPSASRRLVPQADRPTAEIPPSPSGYRDPEDESLRIRDAPIADWTPPASGPATMPPRPAPITAMPSDPLDVRRESSPQPLLPTSVATTAAAATPRPLSATPPTASHRPADATSAKSESGSPTPASRGSSLPSAPNWTRRPPGSRNEALPTASPPTASPPTASPPTASPPTASDSSLAAPTIASAPRNSASPLEPGGQLRPTDSSGETRAYLIEEGDSLWDIAFYELGDATQWTEIYRLNEKVLGSDPTDLRPGTWIQLPRGD